MIKKSQELTYTEKVRLLECLWYLHVFVLSKKKSQLVSLIYSSRDI